MNIGKVKRLERTKESIMKQIETHESELTRYESCQDYQIAGLRVRWVKELSLLRLELHEINGRIERERAYG